MTEVIYDTKGQSITLDMWEVIQPEYPMFYRKFKEILIESGMHVLGDAVHHFNNQGAFTLAFILAESLASCHTYIEHKYISFDIYTCGEADSMKIAEKLNQWLRPEYIQINKQVRGVRGDTV